MHRDTIYVSVYDPHEGTLEQFEISTRQEKQIRAFEGTLRPTDRVALEATTNSLYWYRRLVDRVAEVALANPVQLKLYLGHKAKTDRNDSSMLAVLNAFGCLPTVWVPDLDTEQDRSLLYRRSQLIRAETQERNRIRALLTRHNIQCQNADLGTTNALGFLRKVATDLPFSDKETLGSLLRHFEALREEIERMEQLIYARADRRPEMTLLLTIPGIGLLNGMTILAAIGDVARFKSPRALANYSGLVPRVRSSARRCHLGRITKAGSKSLRWALSIAVESLVKQPGPFQNFYHKLLGKKGKGVAMAACARRLLTVIWHVLTNGEAFRDGNEDKNAVKRARAERKVEESKTEVAARRQEALAREHVALLMELTRARAARPDEPLRLKYLKVAGPGTKVLTPSRG